MHPNSSGRSWLGEGDTERCYSFDELTPDGKENARDWYRAQLAQDEGMYDGVLEWFIEPLAMLGIEVLVHDIQWSGFWCQGDGLSFTGAYSYKSHGLARVCQYFDWPACKSDTVHDFLMLGVELRDIQRRYLYCLEASLDRFPGNAVHSGMMISRCHDSREFCHPWGERGVSHEDEHAITECMQGFANLMYRSLESYWDDITAEVAIDSDLRDMDMRFDERGYPA